MRVCGVLTAAGRIGRRASGVVRGTSGLEFGVGNLAALLMGARASSDWRARRVDVDALGGEKGEKTSSWVCIDLPPEQIFLPQLEVATP